MHSALVATKLDQAKVWRLVLETSMRSRANLFLALERVLLTSKPRNRKDGVRYTGLSSSIHNTTNVDIAQLRTCINTN